MILSALFVSSEILCSWYLQNVVINPCSPTILKAEETCSISKLLSSAFEKCIHATIFSADLIIIRGFVGKLDSDVRWRSIHENPSGAPEIGVMKMSLPASVLARFWRLFASDEAASIDLETIFSSPVLFHEFISEVYPLFPFFKFLFIKL